MTIGDLVSVSQNIPEYVELMGNTVGLVVNICDPHTDPMLVEVQWTGGETEMLYTDELELINRK